MKMVLTDYHRLDFGEYKDVSSISLNINWKLRIAKLFNSFLMGSNFKIFQIQKSNKELREIGRDWPSFADTMIGLKRLNNIEFCFHKVIENKVEGDFIETGVWRGGSTIFMQALIKEYEINGRNVWVADSFEGLPKPNEEKYTHDKGDKHYKRKDLGISLDTVKNNFAKYNLLDDNVKFLKGWFKDTLHIAPIKKLAILRLDGDMYESTMDAFNALYDKLSIGGFLIIDDWGAVKACKQAVLDFRNEHNITEEIKEIDWTGAYWRKEKEI